MKSIARISPAMSCVTALAAVLIVLTFANNSLAVEPDSTFGPDGVGGSIALPNSDSWVAVDTVSRADGSGVMLATSAKSNGFALFSFAENGSPDLGFGSGGRMEFTPGAKRSFSPRDLAQSADGSLIVAGVRLTHRRYRAAAVKITPAGAVDATFGTNGFYEADTIKYPDDADGSGAAVTVDQSQRVLLASAFHGYVMTTRLRPSGVIDRRFGKHGKRQVSFKHYSAVNVRAIAVQSSGAILVQNDEIFVDCDYNCNAGPTVIHTPSVIRLTPSGKRDTRFGTRGAARMNNAFQLSDNTQAMRVLDDGSILLAVNTWVSSGNTEFQAQVVQRFSADGVKDSSFGHNGDLYDEQPNLPTAINDDYFMHDLAATGSGEVAFCGSYLFRPSGVQALPDPVGFIQRVSAATAADVSIPASDFLVLNSQRDLRGCAMHPDGTITAFGISSTAATALRFR